MGFFSNPAEAARKENLKKLEDKRLAFAAKLEKEGFAPERMLFTQMGNGGFSAVARFKGYFYLIISPGFGTDEDFIIEKYETPLLRREDFFVKAEGMAGIFGMGKKGQSGVEYILTRSDGSEYRLPFVAGLNSCMECVLAKNPLLSVKRRRGDANLVWDMRPLDRQGLLRLMPVIESYMK